MWMTWVENFWEIESRLAEISQWRVQPIEQAMCLFIGQEKMWEWAEMCRNGKKMDEGLVTYRTSKQ